MNAYDPDLFAADIGCLPCCQQCWLTIGPFDDETQAQNEIDTFTSNCIGYIRDVDFYDSFTISASGTTSLSISGSVTFAEGAPGTTAEVLAAVFVASAGTLTVTFTGGGSGAVNGTTISVFCPELSFFQEETSFDGSGSFDFSIPGAGCCQIIASNTNSPDGPGLSTGSNVSATTSGVAHEVKTIRAEYGDPPSYLICA